MKKSLIALAALAATASFAQSTVTISGLLDLSYHSVSGNNTNANTEFNSISTSVGSATSNIALNVVEDLGGGMRAQAFYAFDPRNNINNSLAGIGRHEAYVGISGGFGNLRLGSINTANLQAQGAGSVLGTATGSGFAEVQTAAGGAVRFNNSMRYDTPNMNGFAASLTYTPGNRDATSGGAQPEVTDLGLSYTKGPLAVNFSSLTRSAVVAQAAVTPATAPQLSSGGSVTAGTGAPTGQAAVTATARSTYNLIGATYTIGAARLFAAFGDGSKSGTSGVDSKSTRVGASYTMGAVTLLGSYSQLELAGSTAKPTVTGLRADYGLSKRTFAYAGYEALDTGASTSNKRNIAMVGVRHSF